MDLLNETAKVWVEMHPEMGWCPARVDSVDNDGNYIAVDDDGTQFKIPKDKAISVDPCCLRGVEDLLFLGDFNEGGLLHNIRVRYFEDQIYTGIGAPILISINPYQKLAKLYSSGTMAQYRKLSAARSQNQDMQITPHLFSVASECYATMLDESKNQSIIITGESGAGKTEATKRILSYIANIQQKEGTEDCCDSSGIQNQVLKSNPILEAFGNAKTLRNDNSSRFGKFIEIEFDTVGKLFAANIKNYLLEKCRITAQQSCERNYHAFYYLCAGADAALREKLYLDDLVAEDFDFVNVCTIIENAESPDVESFIDVQDCFHRLNFSNEESETLWKCCAAILHLGNIDFEMLDEKQGPEIIEEPRPLVSPICDLLGIEQDALRGVLRTKKFFDPISKSEILTPLRVEQARQVKLSIARVLYSKMFDWLVQKINSSMTADAKATKPTPDKNKAEGLKIGLLDIYGFEVFDWNTFEQLCINFANEKLQQHFNSHMFNMEQKMYSDESINWSHIEWKDNQDIIDALEKKPNGVFPHLDSTCNGPNPTDSAFLQALYTKPAKPSVVYNPSKQKSDLFAVAHYAGEVQYSVDGFLDKNVEKQTEEAADILRGSSNELIKAFVQPSGGAGGAAGSRTSAAASRASTTRGSMTARGSRALPVSSLVGSRGAPGDKIKGPQATVSSTFREQLDSLVLYLNKTHPRYIRCIKPNANKAAHDFDSIDVLRQLRCAGMLESIRIRRAGYSVRRPFKDFYIKFCRLHPSLPTYNKDSGNSLDLKALCERLLSYVVESKLGGEERMGQKTWQVGRSKVFLKEELQKALEAELNQAILGFILVITRRWRGYVCRRDYKKKKRAATELRAFFRTLMQRNKYLEELEKWKATLEIACFFRTVVTRNRFVRIRDGCLRIQTVFRGHAIRKKLGDFRAIKDERDAARKKEKIQRDREDAERKQMKEQIEKQQAEMAEQMRRFEEEKANQAATIAQKIAEERRKETEEAAKKEQAEKDKQAEERRRKEEEARLALEKEKDLERQKKEEETKKLAEESKKKEEENKKLLEEMKKLKEEAAKKDALGGEKLQNEMRELKKEVLQLKSDLEFQQKSCEKYQKDAALYKSQLDEALQARDSGSKKFSDELNTVRKELIETRDTNRALEDQSHSLEEKLKTSELILENKENELAMSQSELKILKDKLESHSEGLQSTSEEKSKLESQLKDLQSSTYSKIADLQRDLDEAVFKVENIEKSKASLSALLQTTMDENREKISELETLVRSLKNENEEISSAKDSAEIELNFLKKKLEDMKANTSKTSAGITTPSTTPSPPNPTAQDGDRSTIANQTDFLKMISEAKTGMDPCDVILEEDDETSNKSQGGKSEDKLRTELREVNRKFAEQNVAFEDMKTEFNIKKEENRRYLTELSTLRGQKSIMETQLRDMVSVDEMQTTRVRLAEVESQNDRLVFQCNNQQKQKDLLEKRLLETETELDTKRKQVKEINAKLTEAELKNNNTSDVDQIKNDATVLKQQVDAAHQQKQLLQSKYDQLKTINFQLKDHMSKMLESKNAVEKENRTLKKDRDKGTFGLDELMAERDRLEGEKTFFSKKNEQLREELTQIRQEKREWSVQEEILKQDLDKHAARCEQLKKQNEELVRENMKNARDLMDMTINSSAT